VIKCVLNGNRGYWKEGKYERNTKEIRKRQWKNVRLKVEGWKGDRLKEIGRGLEVGDTYSNHEALNGW
jgi:hypothetical protein